MLKISYPYAISHLVKLLTILLLINLFIFWVFDFSFRKYLLHTSCWTDAKIALKTWLEIVTFGLWNILVTYFVAHTQKLYWNITWSCTLRLWFHLNWSIVLADVPSVFRYVKQPCTKFTYVSHANLHNKSSSIDVFNLYWTLNALNLTVIFCQAIELMVVIYQKKKNSWLLMLC